MGPVRLAARSIARKAAACAALAVCLACGGERPGAPAPPSAASAPPAAAPPASTDGAAPAAGTGYEEMEVAGGGSVTGRVIYRGAPPERAPVAITKDREVCGRTAHRAEGLVVGRGGGLQNAVVSIDPVPRGKPWPAGARPVLDQRGCWFVPHVLLVAAGTEIDILNSDGILHNIHTHARINRPINLAQPKYKKVLNHAFEKPETVRVVCDVHSWMNAWIVVTAHPYHAVTGEDGAFTLDQVPPGAYTLKAWHETLGTSAQPITVEPGGRAEASLAFGG